MSRPDGEAAGPRDQIIRQNCRTLKTPAIAAQYQRLAEAAAREGHSHVRYLDALLGAEIEERERKAVLRRVKEARLPLLKTLQISTSPSSGFRGPRRDLAAAELAVPSGLAAGESCTADAPAGLCVGPASRARVALTRRPRCSQVVAPSRERLEPALGVGAVEYRIDDSVSSARRLGQSCSGDQTPGRRPPPS